jgi:hypothetical protein
MANMQEPSHVFSHKGAKFLMCFYLHEIAFCFFFAALAPLREYMIVYSGSDTGTHFSMLNFPD